MWFILIILHFILASLDLNTYSVRYQTNNYFSDPQILYHKTEMVVCTYRCPLLFKYLYYATSLLSKTYISPCFSWPREIQRGLLLSWQRVKSENSIQSLFYSNKLPRWRTPRAVWLAPPSPFIRNYTQHLCIKPPSLNYVCEHLCYILNYFVHPLVRGILK